MTKKYKTTPYIFGFSGSPTIKAAIKLFNPSVTSQEELNFLLAEFDKINSTAKPPKPGIRVMIPVLDSNDE